MPPRVWLPNFPLVLRLKPPPRAIDVKMPPAGTHGTFRTSELVFDTIPQLTKPEIKNFLMGVYGLNVKSVNSVVRMGRRRNISSTMPYHEKDFKRFYVKLHDEVELPNVPKALHLVKASLSEAAASQT